MIQRTDPLNNLITFTFRLLLEILLKSRVLSYFTPNHAIYLLSCACKSRLSGDSYLTKFESGVAPRPQGVITF